MELGLSSISSSEPRSGAEARRLLGQLLLLVLLPAALIICLVEWAAWRSGDTVPPALIAQWQFEDPTLEWGGAGQFFAPFKIAGAQLRRPDVLVIGASRAGQFRSRMFKPYSFYNCTMAAWTFGQYKVVLKRILRVYTPKVVIFNLDYFMFGSAYDAHWRERARMDLDYRHIDGLRAFIDDVEAAPRMTLHALPHVMVGRAVNPDGTWVLGSAAIRETSSTFRYDGSLNYSARFRDGAAESVKYLLNILAQVDTGSGRRMDPAEIARFQSFVDLAHRHGITLIGVQLPIYKPAIDVLDAGKDFFQLRQFYGSDMQVWHQFESADTAALFKRMGVIFVDLARMPENADPRYFIDAAHPGEYAVLGATIRMLEDPRVHAVLPKVDVAALKRNLGRVTTDYFDVYYNRF